MKTQLTMNSAYLQHARRRAFSLLEMVVVVAIMGILLALATPYALATLRSTSLTSVGDLLMQKIGQAQMRAVTENRVVALQFYFYEREGVKGCHAVQVVTVDPATNVAIALEDPVFWSDGRAVLLEGPLSPLFSATPAADTGEAKDGPFASLSARMHRIRFYPNGGTSLGVPLRQAYLTFINSERYREGASDPPPNYYTIQIDPVAGRARAYRP